MIAFKRVLINNFRRYKHAEVFPADDKGLFVFIGKNYLGKSTFLNAICWCLYDIQPFTESIESGMRHEHTLLNEDAKRENEFEEVRVELEVQHNKKTYLFVRSWRPDLPSSRFDVMLKRGQDWTPLPNPTTIAELLLPRDLREYFIFAGEDAESLFSPGYETKLKNGVWKVSNIEVLDRAINHLGVIHIGLQQELARHSSSQSVQNALDKKVAHEKERAEKTECLAQLREEVRKHTEIKFEYSEKIKQSAAYTEKIKRREYLEKRRLEIDEGLERIEVSEGNMMTERTPALYLKEILVDVHAALTRDEQMGTLPPAIRVDFINELLKKKKCICGRDINTIDGSDSCLKSLLSDIEPADKFAPLLEDRYPIKRQINELPKFARDLETLQSDKARLFHDKDQLERELKNISEELSGSLEEEISGLEDGIQRIERNIANCIREDAAIEARLQQITRDIEEIDEQIRKHAARQDSAQALKRRLQVIEDAKDAAEYVRERITDQVRKVISAKTDKYFKELFWDKGEYEKIEFTEDYKIVILKKGFDKPSVVLSSGERKVLGIATLRAIADLSGFSGVPIFFDAPLTKLGSEVETSVLQMLPRLAPDKQVFIFNLDSEKMVEFARKLDKKRVYGLSKDPALLNSTVITPLVV